MPSRTFKILSILIFNISFSQITVNATVDASNISKNETINFKINVVNAKGTPRVEISPILEDFKLISGPAQQTNIQWINGAMTSSRSLTWTILAKKIGKINIPSLSVIIDDKKYSTNPIGINVKKSPTKNNLANLFIEVKPNKNIAHVGEQVTVTYKLYTKNNLSIENIEYPKNEGFWSEDLQTTQNAKFRNTQINGVNYRVATLYKVAMFPTKIGESILNPMTVICNVELPSKRGRGVFDDPFFNSMFRETQRQFLQSESLKIDIIPFPKEAPVDFTGAVGEFSFSAAVDTPKVRINEAFTFYIRVAGSGNLNQFNLPKIDFPTSMEVFPPSSSFKRDQFRDDISGEEIYEYVIVPRVEGNYQIGPFSMSYFDPNKKEFLTIKTKALNQNVSPNNGFVGNPSSLINREEVSILSNDIRHIRERRFNWIRQNDYRIPFWALSSYLLSANIFLFPLVFRFTRSKNFAFQNNKELKNASKNAKKSILKSKDNHFKNYSHALFNYLKIKFSLNTDLLDKSYIDKELKGIISDELLEEIISIIDILDFGNFGNSNQNNDNIDIETKLINLIEKIDNSTK